MVDLEHVRSIKRVAQARLLALPGVHTVAVGAKYVNGQPTNEPAILVYVVEKKPLVSLSTLERIPAEIDGVKTDVIQASLPTLRQGGQQGGAEDIEPHDPLVGGVQIEIGAGRFVGTLGCIGFYPADNRVVGITNWHVAVEPTPKGTTLGVARGFQGGMNTVTFTSNDGLGVEVAIRPRFSTAAIGFSFFPDAVSPPEFFSVFVQSVEDENVTDFAQRVADEVNSLANSRFRAFRTGNVVTLDPNPGALITLNPGDASSFGPPNTDPESSLAAKVIGPTISFSGSVSDEFYGLFTSFNFSGQTRTQGIFTRVQEDESLASVAAKVAADLNKLQGVTASVANDIVTVSNPTLIDNLECIVWHDNRVGHPTNGFSACCSDRIGVTVDARHELEIALVQLDPGIEYNGTIADIGFVTGVHTVTPQEASTRLPVKKRGRSSRATDGFVEAIDASGFLGMDPPRQFTDALLIRSAGPGAFSLKGDSGSAIVHVDGNTREVVGFLFGGGDIIDYATPIQQVLDAFQIQIQTETAATQGTPRVVPETASGVAGASAPRAAPVRLGPLQNRIKEVEKEISSTSSGKRFVHMVRAHMAEALTLINQNRRVGAAWQRNGGPILAQAVLRSIQAKDYPLPQQLAGKPLDDCLANIASAFRANAGPDFVSDLDGFTRVISGLGGKTYGDVLSSLEASAPQGASKAAELAAEAQ
jgi:hypothetical protein